jgi:hypothetical protein
LGIVAVLLLCYNAAVTLEAAAGPGLKVVHSCVEAEPAPDPSYDCLHKAAGKIWPFGMNMDWIECVSDNTDIGDRLFGGRCIE